MSNANTASPPLNEVQLLLLRLFSRPMSGEELRAIREMLLAYYESLLQKELDDVVEAKQIKRADFERVLNESQRTQ